MVVEPNKRYPIGIAIVENPVQELNPPPSPTFNNKENYFFAWVALMCRLFSSSSSSAAALFFFFARGVLEHRTELFKGSFKS